MSNRVNVNGCCRHRLEIDQVREPADSMPTVIREIDRPQAGICFQRANSLGNGQNESGLCLPASISTTAVRSQNREPQGGEK
jgi:hypothetical protein